MGPIAPAFQEDWTQGLDKADPATEVRLWELMSGMASGMASPRTLINPHSSLQNAKQARGGPHLPLEVY